MKQYYLIAYDIRHPKRLQRLHYYLSKHSLFLQRSVYLFNSRTLPLEQLIKGIKQRTKNEDDVRLYPVRNPGAIWAAGRQDQAFSGLYGRGAPQRPMSSGLLQRIKDKLKKKRKTP